MSHASSIGKLAWVAASLWQALAHAFGADLYFAINHAELTDLAPGALHGPTEEARQRALERYVRLKIEREVARDFDLLPDPSYPALLARLAAENERRTKTLAAGGVIFGPPSFTLVAYVGYEQGQWRPALLHAWAERTAAVSEAEAHAVYERQADEFLVPRTWVLLEFTARYTGLGATPGLERDAALAAAARLRARLATGEDPTAAVARVAADTRVKLAHAETIVAEDGQRGLSEQRPVLVTQVRRLVTGGLSEVFDEDGAVHLLLCRRASATVRIPFAEVRSVIVDRLVSEKWEAHVAALARRTRVEIVAPVRHHPGSFSVPEP